jgi:hypothetical protein
MPAQELCQRVQNDVGAVFDRAQEYGRSDCIVDEQRQPVLVRHLRQLLDVADIPCRVPNALAVDRASLVVDQLFQRIRMIRLRESNTHSLARQQVREHGVCGSVELRYRDDIASEFGDIEEGIIDGRLPAADAQGFEPSFKCGDAALEDCGGRVRNARVAISLASRLNSAAAWSALSKA